MKKYLLFCTISAMVIYVSISIALWNIDFMEWKEYTKVGVVVVVLIALLIGYILNQLDDNDNNHQTI